jgi:hypothetical protein
LIQSGLIGSVHSLDGRRNFGHDIFHRSAYAFAPVTLETSVPHFQRFAFPGGRPGRYCSSADGTAGDNNIHFNSRISSRIQNLPCFYIYNISHGGSPWWPETIL